MGIFRKAIESIKAERKKKADYYIKMYANK